VGIKIVRVNERISFVLEEYFFDSPTKGNDDDSIVPFTLNYVSGVYVVLCGTNKHLLINIKTIYDDGSTDFENDCLLNYIGDSYICYYSSYAGASKGFYSRHCRNMLVSFVKKNNIKIKGL